MPKEPSLLGTFRGIEYIEKVLCPRCKKRAEQALNKWMTDEFRRDQNKKKPKVFKLVRPRKKRKESRVRR